MARQPREVSLRCQEKDEGKEICIKKYTRLNDSRENSIQVVYN